MARLLNSANRVVRFSPARRLLLSSLRLENVMQAAKDRMIRPGKMPGREQMEVASDDLRPKERPALTVWALIFFGVAAFFGVASWTTGNTSSLLLTLLFFLSAGLGVITLLSRFVRTPP